MKLNIDTEIKQAQDYIFTKNYWPLTVKQLMHRSQRQDGFLLQRHAYVLAVETVLPLGEEKKIMGAPIKVKA